MRGSGRSACSSWKPTAHSVSAPTSEDDDHHGVADRLDHARVVGQRGLDVLDEALDRVEGVLVAGLLGEAGVAGQVGEGDRHAQATEVEVRVLGVDLEVADHVLLDEVREEALVEVVHDRRRERQQVARQALHLLGHLQARDAVADQRLVHVEMEQAHLGVGDRPQRLSVDAHELQEGDGRQAGVDDRREVAQQLQVVLGDGLELLLGETHRRPDALDHRRTRAPSRAPPRRACTRRRGAGTCPPCSRTPAGRTLRGLAQRLQRIAARTQAGDDACVGDGGRCPAVVAQRDDLVAHPAAQRRRA